MEQKHESYLKDGKVGIFSCPVQRFGMQASYLCTINQVQGRKMMCLSGNVIPTGLPSLDEIMKGWHLSDLIVFSSCRSGKMRDLAMTIARNLTVDRRVPVAYFSLCMPSVRFAKGLVAMESGHTLSELGNFGGRDKATDKRIDAAVDKLRDAPLYIDDSPGLSILDFKSKTKEWAGKHGVKLAIIDYVQLMRGHEDAGDWGQELAGIIKALKEAASGLGVAIIALTPRRVVRRRRKEGPKNMQTSCLPVVQAAPIGRTAWSGWPK